MEDLFHTEQDLQRLIGQYESLRLDFKASALLSQPTDRIVKQLTEDVSAFVNTEGGLIVIGIKEGKSGRKSVGVEIDEGVDPAGMPPERLEQLIASNISPSVPGLVVRPIPLSGNKTGRVAYVVIVPKGDPIQARSLGMVEWKLFLDDAPFVSGSIDLGDEIASKRVTLKSTEERPSVIRPATT